MYSYCKGRHVDPDFQFFGTIDCAVLNENTKKLMFYSIVMGKDGFFESVIFWPPLPAETMLKGRPATAAGLRSLFELSPIRGEVKPMEVECMDELDEEELLHLVIADLELVPSKMVNPLISAIKKVFLKR